MPRYSLRQHTTGIAIRANTVTPSLRSELEKAGVKVEDTKEAQEKLAATQRLAALFSMGTKRALDTALRSEDHHYTVMSSADGAKVQQYLEKFAKELKINPKKIPKPSSAIFQTPWG